MSEVPNPVADGPLNSSLTGPLSSIEIPLGPSTTTTGIATAARASAPLVGPLTLRELRLAPERKIPEYTYDPVQQVAVDEHERPLVPSMGKDWTTVEGTHTDGDGGDNELWGWEENK